jgi:hypothetical protein
VTTLFGGHKAVSKVPPRALGIDFTGAEYGRCIPVLFGRNRVPPTVIWYGDFLATAVVTKASGGKGGGSSSATTGWTYSASFLLGLAEGVASVISIYDGTSTVPTSGATLFTGTMGQAFWAHLPAGHQLGYSGTALAAFQNLQLGSSPSLPNYSFEMAGLNQLNAGGGVYDADPKDIITAICTSTQFGVNFTALGSMTNLSTYCKASNLLFSPVYDSQQTAMQAIDDVLKYCNTAAWFSEGVLKFQPYGDEAVTGNSVTYTPNLTAVVDLSVANGDFITNGPGPPVVVKRKSQADSQNMVRLEYKDRANTYHTAPVTASIDNDAVTNGVRADATEKADCITTAATARLVAQNLVQRRYCIRNTYEFKLSWKYCYLEPMDIVTLTDSTNGLSLTPVLITEVQEDEYGLLSIVAEEKPDGVAHGPTVSTQNNGATNIDHHGDPGAVTAPYLFRGPGFLCTSTQPEIWCAVTGIASNWGGCHVYLSNDNTTFTYYGTYSRISVYGKANGTLGANADPDTTHTVNVSLNGSVQLLGGSVTDCDNLVNLAMLDNELISYQTSTLAGGPSYTLGTKIRRGCYGTIIAAHAVNAPFVRLDEGILRMPVDPSMIGQTIYLKFLSFNIFGKGGRTLAGETSYSYVVGTNVELPDVPLTPNNFAVTAVADGVNITWTNQNPASVGCTSIEYSTTSGGTYTVLAQVGPTGTGYVHHFATGETYWYRARARGVLVSAGWSAYTSILSSTGKVFIPPEGHNLILNPGFESNRVGAPVGSAIAANLPLCDNWRVMISDSTYQVKLMTAAGKFNGGQQGLEMLITAGVVIPTGNSSMQVMSSSLIPVVLGGIIQFGGMVKWSAGTYTHAGLTATMSIGIQYYQENDVPVSSDSWSTATPVGGSFVQVTGISAVPTSATKAKFFINMAVANTSGGALTVTAAQTFMDVLIDDMFSYQQMNSQVNLPPINAASLTSRWDNSLAITSSYSTATPSVVTISVTASTLQMGTGEALIAYNSSSGTVNQARSTAITYFLYYLDPVWTGGSKTLNITTDPNLLATTESVVWVGQVTVTVPASGTGSGGGGSGGGGCVEITQWMPEGCSSGLIRAGDDVTAFDHQMSMTFARTVEGSKISIEPCLRLVTESGAAVVASESTPMTLMDGSSVMLGEMLWKEVVVLRGDTTDWETVVKIEDAGMRPVNRISIGGGSYFAGERADAFILTHNTYKP